MKFTVFLFSLFFSAQIFASKGGPAVYEVTITNLTKGQPLSPPVIAVSNQYFKLYHLGYKASQGLQELAQDGKTQKLVHELNSSAHIRSTFVAQGPILPGKSKTYKLEALPSHFLSLASMLAKTNDAFIGYQQAPLYLKKDHSQTFLIKSYDAGAEINNESAAFIPALGSPEVGTDDSEGFVHPHPGIYGVADVNPVTDAFAEVAAKVQIKRIQ